MPCPLCGSPYSQLDYDSGMFTEYGFCEKHQRWFDTDTGEPESPCASCPVGGDPCRDCEDGIEWSKTLEEWASKQQVMKNGL